MHTQMYCTYIHPHAQIDRQPENIMPPVPSTGWDQRHENALNVVRS